MSRKCHGRGEIREITRKQNWHMVRISLDYRIFEDVLYKFRFLTRFSPQCRIVEKGGFREGGKR